MIRIMNNQIDQLLVKAGAYFGAEGVVYNTFDPKKFAKLIVRECCLALWTEECHSSDLAFDEVKRNSKKIKEHFGIDPNEITEDMLARSIKWMEQQLADKKHFGVEE